MAEAENTPTKQPEITVQQRLVNESITKNKLRAEEAYTFLTSNPAVEDITTEEQDADIKARYGAFAVGELGSRYYQFSGIRWQGSTWKANQALFHILDRGSIAGQRFTHHPETSWRDLSPGDKILISRTPQDVSLSTVEEVITDRGSYVKLAEAQGTANWHQVHHITLD